MSQTRRMDDAATPTRERCLEKALDLELRAALYAESKTAYLRVAARWHRLAAVAEQRGVIQTDDGPI